MNHWDCGVKGTILQAEGRLLELPGAIGGLRSEAQWWSGHGCWMGITKVVGSG